MGAWNCAKCGGWIFSFNMCVHDCIPPVPQLEWDDDSPKESDPKAEPPAADHTE